MNGQPSRRLLRKAGRFVAGASLMLAAAIGAASAQTLTIESWRNDDADVWNSQIIPAFNKQHPNIKVQFKADPPTEYNAALNARLAGGTAGDLITCRPFDASLDLFKKGTFCLNDVKGLENFPEVAKAAWSTDDGKTTFCPMASVIHGIIYNKKVFEDLKLTPPKTTAEFRPSSTRSRRTASTRPLPWERRTSGKPPPWASRTSA